MARRPLPRSRWPVAACGLALPLAACGVASGSVDVAADTAVAPAAVPFLPAERCALCHSASPRSAALRDATGADVSPVATWRPTAMAHAFVDPYWRAQLAREVELAPEHEDEIVALCLTCHAPAAHHDARLAGAPPPRLADAPAHPVAPEGVTCAVCHRAGEHGLGTPQSFSGNLDIHGDARVFGPYEAPLPGPMRMHTGYTPTFGPHVSTSALCGACHTLYTRPAPDAAPFLEQAPYLEWRNSAFSDEDGATAESRTCQACHMPDVGTTRIARNPGGRDFPVREREHVRSHAIRGANAQLLELLALGARTGALEPGTGVSPEALAAAADDARAYLAREAARVEIVRAERRGDALELDVRVENLSGHKLPTGYPSRRAWLALEVRAGSEVVFSSGATDARGRLSGVADELALPHLDRIERPGEVQVYERVAADLAGRATTSLVDMATTRKDTRLLPRGWRADGPHAAETAPVGTEGDDDFAAGSDVVTYALRLPPGAGTVDVTASLRMQTIPPAWAASLEPSRTAEARRFLALYREVGAEPATLATARTTVRAGR